MIETFKKFFQSRRSFAADANGATLRGITLSTLFRLMQITAVAIGFLILAGIACVVQHRTDLAFISGIVLTAAVAHIWGESRKRSDSSNLEGAAVTKDTVALVKPVKPAEPSKDNPPEVLAPTAAARISAEISAAKMPKRIIRHEIANEISSLREAGIPVQKNIVRKSHPVIQIPYVSLVKGSYRLASTSLFRLVGLLAKSGKRSMTVVIEGLTALDDLSKDLLSGLKVAFLKTAANSGVRNPSFRIEGIDPSIISWFIDQGYVYTKPELGFWSKFLESIGIRR